jgi:hypothetical protein
VYIAAFFEEKGFVESESENKSLVLIIVVVVIEEIIFFERGGFVRDKSEDKLLMIVIIIIERIIFAVFNLENMRDLIISVIMDLTNSIIFLFMAFGRYEG